MPPHQDFKSRLVALADKPLKEMGVGYTLAAWGSNEPANMPKECA